nr:MAG TPA: hypothetical protein [Caudoviricetes sp.]
MQCCQQHDVVMFTKKRVFPHLSKLSHIQVQLIEASDFAN